MNALQHVESVRQRYVTTLAEEIRKAKETGEFLAAEVVVTPKFPKDKLPPPDEAADMPAFMTIDLLTGTEDAPRHALFINEQREGPLIGAISAGTIEVAVYPFLWEACRVWLRHSEPDFRPLHQWFARWFVGGELTGNAVEIARKPDDLGLAGGVHYLSEPIAEGGGYLFEVDLGSAPVAALLEMLQTLGDMGATDVRIGSSDGSEMDATIAEGLRDPDLTPERFVQLVSELLRDLEGVEAVTTNPDEPMILHIKEKGLDEPYISNLANLWLMLQKATPAQRPRDVGRYLRGHLESRQYRDSGHKPDLSSLRAVIKPFVFIEHIRQFAQKQKEKKLDLVCTRLTGDIWIACVWDRPNGMQFVTANEPEEFGLSLEETHARAVKNYLESPREIATEELDGITVARTHDNYDASLLLDDQFWQSLAPRFKGQILACVPTRDAVLVSSTGSSDGERKLRAKAREYLQSGNHAISTTVLVRRNDGWEVYGETGPVLLPAGAVDTSADAPPTPAPKTVKKPWWKFW